MTNMQTHKEIREVLCALSRLFQYGKVSYGQYTFGLLGTWDPWAMPRLIIRDEDGYWDW